jgi:Fic family protein
VKRGLTGTLRTISTEGGERVQAFVPKPLPPKPPLSLSPALHESLYDAHVALGRLDTITALLPDSSHFLYSYVRKEAVLSSQIEGTQSTLSDLLLFEADELPGVPLGDVSEVSNYVAALDHGIARLRDGFPLSNRLLREIHGVLLREGRGAEKDPGEFRRTQNWLGGTRPGNARYVPPPATEVQECMGALEAWLHDEPERTPPLLKAALSHVQFETIHPFLDGNGRVGRLLVTLILHVEGVLHQPLLYLSLYLKQRRDEYYSLLDLVRKEGDWEAWLEFFAAGVRETATESVNTVQRLTALFRADAERIRATRRPGASTLRLHEVLQARPVASANLLAKLSGLSTPTVYTALESLASLGIVRELTGRARGRVFAYDQYLRALSEGTEPVG